MSANVNENAEKGGHMQPSAVERAARAWEERTKWMEGAKELIPWYNEEVAYCNGRAAGLREALAILGREEA